MRKTFGVVLLVALLVPVGALASTSATGTAKADKIVVAVSSNYAALKQAKARGVFSKAGLDVSLRPMSSAKGVVQAVGGGGAQFGVTDPTIAMWQGLKQSLSYKIVSGAEAYKAKSIGVFAGTAIASVGDLNQATIAIPERGGVPNLGTAIWLDQGGADSSSVTWRATRVPQLGKALTNGATAVVAPAALVKGKSLGDPVGSAFGAGAPLTIAISGANQNSATIKKFVAALAGVQGFTVKLNMDALETEAQAVSDYGLTEDEPDLSTLVWSGAPKS